MKRSYSDLDQHTGDPPFAFGPAARGPRQPKQYQQQTEPSTGKIKACMQCGTTRTPQWREGPYGPKTLCNACGVKRVRAIKAQQQGKNPSQVANPAGASGKKKSSAAARTESIELATTLQLLAGNLDVGPPPAKRQARAGQVGGRGRKANSMQAAASHVPEYDPFDPAAAAAMSAPALGSAVQKAIAAIAAKGSMGGESNPTDSGEEISWSPADHQTAGDAAAAAAGGDASGRRQQQQLRAAMAAAAAAHLQGVGAAAGDAEDLLQATCMQSQQQLEASLAEGYGGAAAAAAAAGGDGSAAAGAAVDEEAAAVANLLSMSAASGDQQQQQPGELDLQPTSSAGKAAMREFVAQLAAGSTPTVGAAAASRSPGRRQSARASPSRAAASVRQRNAAAAAAAAAAAVPEGLLEDEVMYLLGPGMAVMARYVAPEELLEVIKLNELASEAQRSKAAAEAAVEAVEQILRDKQAAALTAQAAARNAMQRLHSYVGVLNSEHSLLLKAAQEQQQSASLANRLAAGGQVTGALSQLDLLAASLQQQQQQMQQVQNEVGIAAPEQQQQHGMPMVNLAGLAAAAAAAATAVEPAGAVNAEQAGGDAGMGLGAGGELVVEPLVVQGVGGDAGIGAVDAALVGADDAARAIAAGRFVDALCAVDAAEPTELLPQQPEAEAHPAAVATQQELGSDCQELLHAAAAAAAPAALPVAQLAAPAAAPVAAMPDVEIQDAQLLGSLQELAAIAGMFTGADNNGAAATAGGSPALI